LRTDPGAASSTSATDVSAALSPPTRTAALPSAVVAGAWTGAVSRPAADAVSGGAIDPEAALRGVVFVAGAAAALAPVEL
jgi:hypothetical protein